MSLEEMNIVRNRSEQSKKYLLGLEFRPIPIVGSISLWGTRKGRALNIFLGLFSSSGDAFSNIRCGRGARASRRQISDLDLH